MFTWGTMPNLPDKALITSFGASITTLMTEMPRLE
jgi:hypothetical protein